MAVALGLKAFELGHRTLFITAAGLIATLGKALAENRLDEKLKLLVQPAVLIIDEIGYPGLLLSARVSGSRRPRPAART